LVEVIDLDEEVTQIQLANMHPCFRSRTRDEVETAFRNRTSTPAVGHYSPRWNLIEKKE